MDKLFSLFLKEKEYLENCSPRTIKFFRCSYNTFKRSTEANELNKQVLTEFVVGMRQRGLSAKSCNDYIAGMNSFFKWLHDNEYASELFKIPRMKEEKKVLRSFSDKELKKIITYKPKSFSQVRVHSVLLTLIDTGCRIDELHWWERLRLWHWEASEQKKPIAVSVLQYVKNYLIFSAASTKALICLGLIRSIRRNNLDTPG